MRSWESNVSQFNPLTVTTLSSKFRRVHRLIFVLPHLPIRNDTVRRIAKEVIDREIKSYKLIATKGEYKALRDFWRWIVKNYYKEESQRNFKYWAADEPKLGSAYHNSSSVESLNKKIKKVCKKEGTFQNQVQGLQAIMRGYEQNRMYHALKDGKTKKRARHRIMKSIVLVLLYHETKKN